MTSSGEKTKHSKLSKGAFGSIIDNQSESEGDLEMVEEHHVDNQSEIMSHGSQKVDTDVLAAKFKGVEGADMDLKELFKIHKGLETQLSSIDPKKEEVKET